MSKRKRVAKMTERGIMVDPKELHKLGPVEGAFAMIADLLGDVVAENEDGSALQEKEHQKK